MKILTIPLLLLFCVTCLFCSCAKSKDNAFSITFINCENCDCSLICFDDGKTALIGYGNSDKHFENTVTHALNSRAITQIDYLILPTLTADAIGGTTFIFNNYTVSKIFMPYAYNLYDIDISREFFRVVSLGNCEIFYTDTSQEIISDNYTFQIVVPEFSCESDVRVQNEFGLSYTFPPSVILTHNNLTFTFAFSHAKEQDLCAPVFDFSLNNEHSFGTDFLKLPSTIDGHIAEFCLNAFHAKNVYIPVSDVSLDENVLSKIYMANASAKIHIPTNDKNLTVQILDGKIQIET